MVQNPEDEKPPFGCVAGAGQGWGGVVAMTVVLKARVGDTEKETGMEAPAKTKLQALLDTRGY